MYRGIITIAAAFLLTGSSIAEAQSLRGSAESVSLQNEQARLHDYTYLERPADIRRFVSTGLLVRIEDNPAFRLGAVSYPYALPEVKLFLERLGQQYRDACGEVLVVTSLVRPNSGQPRNASDQSVHPTGMAVDLRRTTNPQCRRWLEDALLHLERRGVAEVTYERRPPHYHVALFPNPYLTYIGVSRAALRAAAPPPFEPLVSTYTVRRGDSLWEIARRYGTTVEALRAENGLKTSRVFEGQVLRIPDSR